MSVSNQHKPIFVVVYLFMIKPANELRIVNWTPISEKQNLPFRYAAQVEANSIEDFLFNELKLLASEIKKPENCKMLGSLTEGITLYDEVNFQVKDIAVQYTYMYENDLGIFYAITVATDHVFIPQIGIAKSSVVYNLETVEASVSDTPNFEEQKQQLLKFFNENESKLRARFECSKTG